MTEEIKNGNVNNIDSLLVETMNEETPSFLDTEKLDAGHETKESEPVENVSREVVEEAPQEKSVESQTDEYGNEIPKQEKVYTKAEVEAMIRDRVSRMKMPEAQQPIQPQQQPANEPESGDWEHQLASFIDKRLSEREQQVQRQTWERQAQEQQAQFEVKFNAGVAKYPDFESVVYGKSLTPEMVMATRGMSDPAAFIYAAAKTQAKELERISSINDPYAQAVEVGQLAERMRKARSPVSQAPRPIDAPKGDVVEKQERTRNIDDKIQMEEIRLRKERARR